ncbi:unnamed protein product [Angiostrongylus costaricensis]|uniref:P4Ha_N domain-containing protein n=1 Tax=Angiostrongylus costaricensis TaxID=334426 RepID=A0A158PK97_ANGCS|nr:unnamed protein product [Angiostrongylus costaricensis]
MWCLGVLLLLLGSCTADLFTAIADMQKMLGAEKEVTNIIENYIEAEQKRLDDLKRFADEYVMRNKYATDIGPDFVTNPINAYLLIKRLTSEWKKSQSLFTENNLFGQVGRAAYNERDYYHTLTWMQAAMNKLENENPKSIDEAEVLEYLAYALYQQGNVRRALTLTRRLAAIAPNHPRARGKPCNVKWYEDMLDGKDMEGELPPVVNKRVENDGIVERDAYEALCRGETVATPPEVEKELYCYLKMDKPFLKLAPIKVEILRLEPLAVLFKEVMSDYEMEVIKAVATPKLERATVKASDGSLVTVSYRISKSVTVRACASCRRFYLTCMIVVYWFQLRRATVQNAVTGALETASYRISKSAWLKDEDHPVIARVNKRIHDMTNLNQDTSEDLQVFIFPYRC